MDVLRGFALLGILVMNIQLFAMVEAAHNNPTAYGDLNGANFLVWLFSHLLADQKFISIFSMLFGAGIVLMWQKAESSGARPTRLHYRRVGWMILFGVLHAHLLWYGDILYTYGMCGLFVYLFRRKSPRTLISSAFRRKSPRTLISSALVLAVIGSLIAIGLGLFWVPHWPPDIQAEFIEDWQPSPQSINEELAAYRGSWIDQMSDRVPSALDVETSEFLTLYGWKASSLMLLGMALFKLGAFHIPFPMEPPPVLVACGSGAARGNSHDHLRRRSRLRKKLGRSICVVPGRAIQLLGELSRRAGLDRTDHALVPGFTGLSVKGADGRCWPDGFFELHPAIRHLHHDLLRARLRLFWTRGAHRPDSHRLRDLCGPIFNSGHSSGSGGA